MYVFFLLVLGRQMLQREGSTTNARDDAQREDRKKTNHYSYSIFRSTIRIYDLKSTLIFESDQKTVSSRIR
jgi:hypothetical protein